MIVPHHRCPRLNRKPKKRVGSSRKPNQRSRRRLNDNESASSRPQTRYDRKQTTAGIHIVQKVEAVNETSGIVRDANNDTPTLTVLSGLSRTDKDADGCSRSDAAMSSAESTEFVGGRDRQCA